MLSRLAELEEAGVSSFKIEGRMKSEYYLATVINAYRRALDGGSEPRLEKELSNVAHREYTQGYAFGENRETVNYADSQTKGDYTYIANVLGGSEGIVEVEMRNRFREGDTLEVLSPDDNFGKTFEAKEIFDEGGLRTADAKLVQAKYKISCPYHLKKGDFLRRKNA
ncbi:MAG: U32 family peptidase C-terminal domain-containing protein [Christensenellaceae bacterium]